MELDKNHIYLLLTFKPCYSIEQTVKRLKQVTTNYIYDKCEEYLKQYYYKKKKILWSRGYFCSTIEKI